MNTRTVSTVKSKKYIRIEVSQI